MNNVRSILIIGAGTIGLTYGWYLSKCHDVSFMVKREKTQLYKKGVCLSIKDLRKNEKKYEKYSFHCNIVYNVDQFYDLIIVCVNRNQLKNLNTILEKVPTETNIIFMQNHWDIKGDIQKNLNLTHYFLGFPQQVGGGRCENQVKAIVYDTYTRIGGKYDINLKMIGNLFEAAGFKVKIDHAIVDWLRIHYLQQSITIGALLKSKGYGEFSKDFKLLIVLAKSLKEGIMVCKKLGIDLRSNRMSWLKYIPNLILAIFLHLIFSNNNTKEMIEGHRKNGESEWISGYYEILKAGKDLSIDMTYWQSFKPYVDKRYFVLNKNQVENFT